MDKKRSFRIERQHQTEMALRAIDILNKPYKDASDLKDDIKAWTDYFISDLDRLEDLEEEDPTTAWGQFCGKCGEKMIHKQGVNSKTNKPWAGWFCTKDESHEPRWERNVV